MSSITKIVKNTVCKSIVCGGDDFNTYFYVGRGLLGTLSTFMQELQVVAADTLLSVPGLKSYRRASLSASAYQSLFFVPPDLYTRVCNVSLLDNGDNLSDHLPPVMKLVVQF